MSFRYYDPILLIIQEMLDPSKKDLFNMLTSLNLKKAEAQSTKLKLGFSKPEKMSVKQSQSKSLSQGVVESNHTMAL